MGQRRRSLASIARPDRQLVPVGIAEVETAAAREGKDRLHDRRAGAFELLLGCLEIVGVEDHQGAARPDRSSGTSLTTECKTAGEAAVAELAVARTVILEGPTESLAVECARASDVGDQKFDVVDALIVA